MYPNDNNNNKSYYRPQPKPVTTGIPVNAATTGYNYAQSIESSAFYIDEQHQEPAKWSTGLCHCLDDPKNSCVTCCCPCITFGQIAEIVDRGSTSCGTSGALYTLILCLTGCQCIYSCFYRQKMRAQYSLEKSPCNDCCVHWCCECCALCQEYRELKRRGFDMSIGWHANMERQGRGAANVPPMVPGGMTR